MACVGWNEVVAEMLASSGLAGAYGHTLDGVTAMTKFFKWLGIMVAAAAVVAVCALGWIYFTICGTTHGVIC